MPLIVGGMESGGRCASWPSTPTSGTRRASPSTSTQPSARCWRAICRAVGRDPAAIRHSLMIPVITGRTPAVRSPRGRPERAYDLPSARRRTPRAGAPPGSYGLIDEVRQEIKRWDAAGMSRLMLPMLDMEDLEAIRPASAARTRRFEGPPTPQAVAGRANQRWRPRRARGAALYVECGCGRQRSRWAFQSSACAAQAAA